MSEQLPDAKMWDKYLMVWCNKDHNSDLESMNMTKIEHGW